MHEVRRRKIAWRIIFVVLAIIADQTVKFCANKDLLPKAGGFLDFACNENIAWGIPLKGAIFFVFWAISALILFFITKKHAWNFFLLLVLGGAISNMIDRVMFGCVVDYISIGKFPIFNIADVMITIGVGLFLIQNIKNK